MKGKGIAQDRGMAVKWLQAAAEQGHAPAQHRLGHAYLNGNNVKEDRGTGIKWLQKAVEQDYPKAQLLLAEAYWNGFGIEYDPEMAVKLYKKAAKQDCGQSSFAIGYAYQKGVGVPKSLERAIKWYKRSADQGYNFSLRMLGEIYEKGKGVSKDVTTALEWYVRGGIQNETDSQQFLTTITGKLQDVAFRATDATHERLENLEQLLQPFIAENYLQAGLHRPGCGLGHVNNPAVASFYKKIADFGREISRIIEGFNSPGFMVKFATPQAIADFSSVNEERHIQRYSRLDNLVCVGDKVVKIGNLLSQILFEEHELLPLSFAQITTLISHQIDKVSHSIEQLEIESVTLDALIQSCAPVLNDEEYVKKHQQNLRQLAQRYAREEETVANLVTESQFQKQAEEFRNRLFAEYLNKMIICENALEHQQNSHKKLKDQLSTVNTIRSELLELLNLGVNERNNRLKALYPWLG